MPTRIRLQRRGKKGQAFYHIVIADGRAPRDGRFIEKIGIYNPLTKPATIELNFDKALDWVTKGAQPSDTVKAILSYKGVSYKYHLMKGVAKGAMTADQAEEKFQTWLQDKEARIARQKSEAQLKIRESRKKALDYESKVNESKAQEIAKKQAALNAEATPETPSAEETAPAAETSQEAAPQAE